VLAVKPRRNFCRPELLVTMPKKRSVPSRPTQAGKKDEFTELRMLAHDLSNSLEAILQASYLLGQAKLDESSRRWAELIDLSSQQAARINREIRKHLRALSED
jgi:nitrogen-specific signal transduction histidine kinase